jgi:hypothetical protein
MRRIQSGLIDRLSTAHGWMPCISRACCYFAFPKSQLHINLSYDCRRRHTGLIVIFSRSTSLVIMPMFTESNGFNPACFAYIFSATFIGLLYIHCAVCCGSLSDLVSVSELVRMCLVLQLFLCYVDFLYVWTYLKHSPHVGYTQSPESFICCSDECYSFN